MSRADAPSFTNIAKGDSSGQQLAKQVTVRTAAEWKALWKDHAPTEKMPAVDFSKYMVVGIFLGTKPSAGHEVEIVGVRTEGEGSDRRVRPEAARTAARWPLRFSLSRSTWSPCRNTRAL